jgi:hypothetical protein
MAQLGFYFYVNSFTIIGVNNCPVMQKRKKQDNQFIELRRGALNYIFVCPGYCRSWWYYREENLQPSSDTCNGDKQDDSLLTIYMILECEIILTITNWILSLMILHLRMRGEGSYKHQSILVNGVIVNWFLLEVIKLIGNTCYILVPFLFNLS